MKEACHNSGHNIQDHFEDFLGMVEIGSGARRKLPDVRLSRYACYLIIQNGDPTKPVIANGQTYFAIQTRRQELAANLFRATQTEEKLRREKIKGKEKANQTHHEVGAKVRQTIKEIGGTMPKDLPTPDKGIKKLGRQQKNQINKDGEKSD